MPRLPPGSPTILCHHRVTNIHSCGRDPTGMAERGVEAQAFAGAEPVERDGEELNVGRVTWLAFLSVIVEKLVV